jgi:hypothetical protein
MTTKDGPPRTIRKLPPLTGEQKVLLNLPKIQDTIALMEIVHRAIANFEGKAQHLERAIGALFMGYHFGWRAVRVFHAYRTVKQYEDILGIDMRETFDEEGPAAFRSVGYVQAESVGFYPYINSAIDIFHDKQKARQLISLEPRYEDLP